MPGRALFSGRMLLHMATLALKCLETGADPGRHWGPKPPVCGNGALGREGLAGAEGAWKSLVVQFPGPVNHHAAPFSCDTALQMHRGALRS